MVGPTPDIRSIDPAKVAVFEVRPGLWNLRIPLVWPGISHVNVAVLSGADGGITLVDCGTAGDPTCWDALLNGLAETGHGIADVTDLVITHAHSDHFGLATRVVAESGCTMWMHPAHEAFTDSALEPERIYAARERRARAEGVPEDVLDQYADTGEETDFALTPLPAFNELHTGMQIPSALGPWDVLETPGHSPSHVCLYQPQERLLHPRRPRLARLRALVRLRLHGRPGRGAGGVTCPRGRASTSTWRFPATAARSRTSPRSSSCTRRSSSGGSSSSRRRSAREPGPAYEIGLRAFGPSPSMMAEVGRLQEAMACLRHLRLQGRVVRDVLPSGVFRYSLADDDPESVDGVSVDRRPEHLLRRPAGR